ncbi:hypothetical protein P9112_000904 [Eukaryota sp. TZLM1-RC]
MHSCSLCGSSCTSFAVFPCSHFLCSVCALKLRLIYKDSSCPYCKSSCTKVVISDRVDEYSILLPHATYTLPETPSVFFTSPLLSEQCQRLIGHYCPKCPDLPPFRSSSALSKHVESTHNRSFCRICLSDNPRLSCEQVLYTQKNLSKHLDGTLANEKPFTGHPKCPCCGRRSYNDEHLFRHVINNHITCHLCQQSIERTGRYSEVITICFKSQKARIDHFHSKHYVCHFPQCLETNLSVFDNELDLAKHVQTEHKHNMPILLEMFDCGRPEGQKSVEKRSSMTDLLERAEAFDRLPIHFRDERSKIAVERVRKFLKSQENFELFLNISAFYRDGAISASEYFSHFCSLFNLTPQSEADSLFCNLVSLLPNKQKRIELANEYSNWEKTASDFPTLTGKAVPQSRKSPSVSGLAARVGQGKVKKGPDFPELPRPTTTRQPCGGRRIVTARGHNQVVDVAPVESVATQKKKNRKKKFVPLTV